MYQLFEYKYTLHRSINVLQCAPLQNTINVYMYEFSLCFWLSFIEQEI